MEDNMSRARTVVIAIDDSEHSLFAFDFFLNNVYKQGDRIVLVHVPEIGDLLTTSSLLTDPNIVNDLLKESEEKTLELVGKYSVMMKERQPVTMTLDTSGNTRIGKRDFLRKGLAVLNYKEGHVKQLCGKPGEAIIEAAKEVGASMLILGSRGMGMVRRTLLGSVSDYCVHHCNIPVIVCKNKDPKNSSVK